MRLGRGHATQAGPSFAARASRRRRSRAEGLDEALRRGRGPRRLLARARSGTRSCALVGPNGSGKTTALRILAGTVRARRAARSCSAARSHRPPPSPTGSRPGSCARCRRRRSSTSSRRSRTCSSAGRPAHVRRRRSCGRCSPRPEAAPRRRARASRRARGARARRSARAGAAVPPTSSRALDQRLLMLATALATRPSVLLLDETSAGAGSADLDRVRRRSPRPAGRGDSAVLLVEHNLGLRARASPTASSCSTAGRTIAAGRPEEVAAGPAVRAAYLGRRS